MRKNTGLSSRNMAAVKLDMKHCELQSYIFSFLLFIGLSKEKNRTLLVMCYSHVYCIRMVCESLVLLRCQLTCSKVLTNCMEHSPWEANCHSACQEIHHLWNKKVHFRVHKSLPPPLIQVRGRVENFVIGFLYTVRSC